MVFSLFQPNEETPVILAFPVSPTTVRSGLWLEVNSLRFQLFISGLNVDLIIKFLIGLYSKYTVPKRLLVFVLSKSNSAVATGLLNGAPITSLKPL